MTGPGDVRDHETAPRSRGGPRIALIHALQQSIAPARAAFQDVWPEARLFDLLDTSLSADLAHGGSLDGPMIQRFASLGDYASRTVGVGGRTAGILFTCSAFGGAIDQVKQRLYVPVLRPNEAAFEEALSFGSRLGLIVTFGPSLAALVEELQWMAEATGQEISIQARLAEGALAALESGEPLEHDRLVADAAASLEDVDAIILGQFSAARARSRVEATYPGPVLTTPTSAVQKLRRLITAAQQPDPQNESA
jgi:Asp/Glu/hydantoin racemase